MSQELQQYTSIIEQLKPMVKEPEFNYVLSQVAGHIPKEKRFLIKMEVKRLAKPCIRSIDLRGQLDTQCNHFIHSNIGHYLDEAATDLFEQQLRIFGQYSFGVYEAVVNDAKKRALEDVGKNKGFHLAEDASDTSENTYKAPIVNLLNYPQRNYERMNFAVSLEVFTEQNKSIMATSIDISISGIKLKTLSDTPFNAGEKVSVYFRGLEAEFAITRRDSIAYKIIDTARGNREKIIRLERCEEHPNPLFDEFLERFIHGNKRRYKVNMNNTIDAIINKSCEQYFSPLCPSLPVFIDSIENKLIPRFAMLNSANKDILDYWTDERDKVMLAYLLSPARLASLCRGEYHGETTIYAFNHIQDERIYFYSAMQEELDSNIEFKKLFLGFGSKKVSWRVFKLKAIGIRPEDAHSPLSIPDSISKKIKSQNTPPPPRLMAKLKHLKYIIHVTDITSELGQQCYAAIKIDRGAIKGLKEFAHARNRIPANIKAFRYKHEENRTESRYLLRSNVEVTQGSNTLSGVTEDISTNGVRIELSSPFEGAIDNRVSVNFTKLQSMTTKFNVSSLKYRVVHLSSDYTIMHLRCIAGDEGLPARTFFDELIKQNRSRLKTYPEEEEYPGIGHALRCINAKSITESSFIVQKKQGQHIPYACVCPETSTLVTTIASFLTKPGEVDLEFLFREEEDNDSFIDSAFKQAKLENCTVNAEIFISFDSTQTDKEHALTVHWSHKFASHKVRKSFIDKAMKRGQFIALKVAIAHTQRPDLAMLQLEMNYVGMYALHRVKLLEENLWSVVGGVHLFDITEETMRRYHYSTTVIKNNRHQTSVPKVETDGIKALLSS
ncbi:PilZ domain-containing protein [Alteromonas sp. 5E99-2]|uniref:PilZ domain-containing protein n=1 Tax=Alteromonas sp. 5E99-2 TaxID=2817683 RepID=UPI001A980EF3|nr:PilZ domain-containing protein [Alteromonas sp. 5E99-2]MBO1255299.1 PilZ domain-containing protein [Alteromonas sp. 5E99-2]